MRRTYKYRAYPTPTQGDALHGQVNEACRLYNAALDERRSAWRMNGIGLGATNDFLAKQEQGKEPALSEVIKQPQVYPKPGYYPHKWSCSYDPSRQVHVFALQDFQQATNVLVQWVRH